METDAHGGTATSPGAETKCVVSGCKEDHPPWRCTMLKQLVQQRNDSKTKRCFSCLTSGHGSINCKNVRQCNDPSLSTVALPGQPINNVTQPTLLESSQSDSTTKETSSVGRTYTASGTKDRISLMVLPAIIENGNKKLKVNAMLDPCSHRVIRY